MEPLFVGLLQGRSVEPLSVGSRDKKGIEPLSVGRCDKKEVEPLSVGRREKKKRLSSSRLNQRIRVRPSHCLLIESRERKK